MRNLDVWYFRIDFERVLAEVRDRLDPAAVKRLRRNREKAERKDSMRAFAKLTRIVDGQPRLVSDPPLIVSLEDVARNHGLGDRTWTK